MKNISREGPGIIDDLLREHGLGFRIIESYKEAGHVHRGNIGALIVLGGPDSANDQTEKIRGEISLIKKCLDAGIPVLGICLGLQALVKAAGGSVVKSPVKEAGFRDEDGDYYSVELMETGKRDPLFRGIDSSLKVFQLHGEMVNTGANMELLATGKYCRNQVIKVGSDSYGIQGHHEITRELLDVWMNEDNDLMKLDKKSVIKDFEDIKEDYLNTGRQIFLNFLTIAGLI